MTVIGLPKMIFRIPSADAFITEAPIDDKEVKKKAQVRNLCSVW